MSRLHPDLSRHPKMITIFLLSASKNVKVMKEKSEMLIPKLRMIS
jgi:hypothetical protein